MPTPDATARSRPAGLPSPGQMLRDVPRCVDSAELLQGALEIHIRHGRRLYRLRQTRHGKLILTT